MTRKGESFPNNSLLTSLEYAIPGGLIGIGTTLDPSLCKSNKCVGQHITHFNKNPKIVYEIDISYMRFKRDKKVKLEKNDKILVGNAGNIIEAVILKKRKNKLKLTLKAPIYLNTKRVCLISDKDTKMIVIGIANIDGYKLIANIQQITSVTYSTYRSTYRSTYSIYRSTYSIYSSTYSYIQQGPK